MTRTSPTDKSILVSICVPVYNHENYVVDCILSIIAQDYENIELIIINDGSTDGSLDKIYTLKNLCESRFKRFELINRPNKGLGPTLNEALEKSVGKYFCSIASDDILLPHKTSILVDFLEKNKQSAGVFGGIKLIDENGEAISEKKNFSRSYDFKDIILHRFFLPAPAQLLRLDMLKKVGGYDASFRIEDWSMWLKLTSSGYELNGVDSPVAYYRHHIDNTSTKKDLMRQERLKILSTYKENALYEQAIATVFLISTIEKIRVRDKKAVGDFIEALKAHAGSVLTFRFFGYLLSRFLLQRSRRLVR